MPDQNNPNRIAVLFNTKRGNLIVGGSRGDDLQHLISVIKEALAANKGVTFFVWLNAEGERTAGSISVGVEQDRPQGSNQTVGRRPIQGASPQGAAPAPAVNPAPARRPARRNPVADLFEPETSSAAAHEEASGW